MRITTILSVLSVLSVSFCRAQNGGQNQSAIPDNLSPVFQLEPIVITAPRAQLPESAPIDPQINMYLLQLLDKKMNSRPDSFQSSDPALQTLSGLSTLDGYNLKVRYTQLGFLLTEGLAGSKDFQLLTEIEKAARFSTNVQIKAAAMVALAYTHNSVYLGIFQSALQDQNITVRFGALESLLVFGGPSIQPMVATTAQTDSSKVMQMYSAASEWRSGDVTGRDILLRLYQDPDWFVRAMATHYIGELGGVDDYWRLMQQMQTETNPSVLAELCSALLRLRHFKNQ